MKLRVQTDSGDRLYFIVRSWMISQISGIIFLAVVLYLGKIDFIQTLILGAFVFVASLAISRCFDKYITVTTIKVLKFLNKRPRVKKFILEHF